MTFTLPETLWLAEQGFEDLLLAYPTADVGALGELALRSAANPAGAPIVMVDCVEHLDAIEAVLGAGAAPVRVCIDVDAGWWALGGRIKVGPKRSPIHTVEQAVALAREIERAAADRTRRADGLRGPDRRRRRPAAGTAPARGRDPLHAAPLRRRAGRAAGGDRRRRSSEFVELRDRQRRRHRQPRADRGRGGGDRGDRRLRLLRARPLRPLQPLQPHPRRRLRAADRAQARRRRSRPRSAAATSPPAAATPAACRRPGCRRASKLDPEEGAGEVQTPLLGAGRRRTSQVGDRVYLRHAKAGELCERFDSLHLVEGDEIVDVVPTYRGEGKAFL